MRRGPVGATLGRYMQAVSLRAKGLTYLEIRDRLGYAEVKDAWRAVREGLKLALEEPAAEVRALERARLDKLLCAVWDQAMQGDGQAIDRVLRIMERRARLDGLDAPAVVDLRRLPDEQILRLLMSSAPPALAAGPPDPDVIECDFEADAGATD